MPKAKKQPDSYCWPANDRIDPTELVALVKSGVVRYPNATYMVDAKESIIFTSNESLSAEEIDRIFRGIQSAILQGDFWYAEQFPFIGRIYRGTSPRPSIPPSVKREVLSVGKCAHCGGSDRLEVDHIKPYSRGGTHARKNLQPLCKRCNRRKFNRTEKELRKLTHA